MKTLRVTSTSFLALLCAAIVTSASGADKAAPKKDDGADPKAGSSGLSGPGAGAVPKSPVVPVGGSSASMGPLKKQDTLRPTQTVRTGKTEVPKTGRSQRGDGMDSLPSSGRGRKEADTLPLTLDQRNGMKRAFDTSADENSPAAGIRDDLFSEKKTTRKAGRTDPSEEADHIKVDPKKLKQDLGLNDLKQRQDLRDGADKDPGLTSSSGDDPSKHGYRGVQGRGGRDWGGNEDKPKGIKSANGDSFNPQVKIHGSKYGDTFQGGRINSQGGEGTGTGGFTGGGKGNASEGEGIVSTNPDGTKTGLVTNPDGSQTQTQSGKNGEPTSSCTLNKDSSGTCTFWNANGGKESSWSWDKNGDGRATFYGKDGSVYSRPVHDRALAISHKNDKTPNPEDNDGGGVYTPVGPRTARQQQIQRVMDRIATLKSQAGGKGDGRGERDGTGSGGPVITGGHDDKPIKKDTGGTLSMEEALKINRVADPTRDPKRSTSEAQRTQEQQR